MDSASGGTQGRGEVDLPFFNHHIIHPELLLQLTSIEGGSGEAIEQAKAIKILSLILDSADHSVDFHWRSFELKTL